MAAADIRVSVRQLIVASSLSTWVVRGFVTAIFTAMANQFRRSRINHKEQIVIFFSGTMRGCVAFALALKVDEDEQGLEEGVFSTTILAISIFTTLIFGGVSSPILKALGLKGTSDHAGHQPDTAQDMLRAPLLSNASTGDKAQADANASSEVTKPADVRASETTPTSGDIDQSVEVGASLQLAHTHETEESIAQSQKFGHPASFSGNTQVDVAALVGSTGSRSGRLGRLHKQWKALDEKWLKPLYVTTAFATQKCASARAMAQRRGDCCDRFGGLPRLPNALEQKQKALMVELATAREDLQRSQREVGEREELGA
jgi:hypothetical protein